MQRARSTMRSAAWHTRARHIRTCVRQVSALAEDRSRDIRQFSSPYIFLSEICWERKIAISRAQGSPRERILGARKHIYNYHTLSKRRCAWCRVSFRSLIAIAQSCPQNMALASVILTTSDAILETSSKLHQEAMCQATCAISVQARAAHM